MMRKVKFIGDERMYDYLIFGKIYDVVRYISSEIEFWDSVIIIANGEEHEFYLHNSKNVPIFQDVTSECRNNVIKYILK